MRFSKGIHPETVQPAAERAAELMRQHAGGTVCTGSGRLLSGAAAAAGGRIEVERSRSAAGHGVPQGRGDAHPARRWNSTCKRRGRHPAGDGADASPRHPRRQRRPHRGTGAIHGYDRLPATLLADRLPRQQTNVASSSRSACAICWSRCGLQEVITYALTMPERERIAWRRARVRPAQEPDLQRTGRHAAQRAGQRAGSRRRQPAPYRRRAPVRDRLCLRAQSWRQASRRAAPPGAGADGACATQEFWSDSQARCEAASQPLDFFDLKGDRRSCWPMICTLPGVTYAAGDRRLSCCPAEPRLCWSATASIGAFGQLHHKAAEAFGLGTRPILVGEFDLEALQALVPARYSLYAGAALPGGLARCGRGRGRSDIGRAHRQRNPRRRRRPAARRPAVRPLSRREHPRGTKSLAYALTYQADDRTLTDKEVDKAHKKIEDRLKHVLKAQIRGKD